MSLPCCVPAMLCPCHVVPRPAAPAPRCPCRCQVSLLGERQRGRSAQTAAARCRSLGKQPTNTQHFRPQVWAATLMPLLPKRAAALSAAPLAGQGAFADPVSSTASCVIPGATEVPEKRAVEETLSKHSKAAAAAAVGMAQTIEDCGLTLVVNTSGPEPGFGAFYSTVQLHVAHSSAMGHTAVCG